MNAYRTVPIGSVKVDRKDVDRATVALLVESIKAGQLLNPVSVNSDLKVIAGKHRYWAVREAGLKEIDVHVLNLDEHGQRLATIDENLMRKDRSALDLGEMLRERKALYQAAHPEAPKRGGDRSKTKTVRSATADAAGATGRTERSVQQYVSVAEKIDPQAKVAIAKTEAADNLGDLQRLAKMEPKKQRAVAARVAKTGVTVKQAARELKHAEQVKQARAYVPPAGEFEVIVVDYPWEYDDQLDGSDAVRGGCPYPPMSIEGIRALPLPAAKDCALFCWVTNSHLIDPEAYAVVARSLKQRYGFEPKGIATWEKDRIGNGWYFRNKTEHLVLFIRGKPVFTEAKPWSYFRAPVGEHSEKPEAAFLAIEKFCASPSRLEMFARTERAGWVTSGSELETTVAQVPSEDLGDLTGTKFGEQLAAHAAKTKRKLQIRDVPEAS